MRFTSSLIFSLLIVTAFSFVVSPNAVAAEKVKLALNWKPEPQFGGFYAVLVGEHDKKNGLELEVMPGGAGTPVVQMVAAGQAPFGVASADEVILARSRGADVVALFASYQTNPQAIMAHEERRFQNLSDVYANEGTLAIQKGLPYALYLEKKFANAGIKTRAKIVPYLGGIQNFIAEKNYSQQCFATSEPLAAQKQKLKVKTFLVADSGYNPYTTVLIVRGDYLKKNEAVVKSMVKAVRTGWIDYLNNPLPTNRKMAELNKSMDDATFAESAAAQKHLIETPETQKNGLGTMTTERWQTLIDQLVDLKLVKQPAATATHFRNF